MPRAFRIRRPPAAAPKAKVKKKRRLPKVVWRRQWAALLNAARCPRDRALMAVMLYTGLRVSEACALVMRDVDFDGEQIHVRHGKGDKEAWVQAHPEALRELRAFLETRGEQRPGNPVFRSQCRGHGGGHLSRCQAWRVIKAAGTAADVLVEEDPETGAVRCRLSPHALRHSAATRLLESGADLRVVQAHMRHESIATTEIYTHVADTRLRDAVRQM